ncbi:MAG: M23 family metallopeptidase [Firmicutes bacterium]|nr:M23 family metallopeptidase [Bacillota bacterium]
MTGRNIYSLIDQGNISHKKADGKIVFSFLRRLLLIGLVAWLAYYFYAYRPWPPLAGTPESSPPAKADQNLSSEGFASAKKSPLTFEVSLTASPRVGEAATLLISWSGDYDFARGQVRLADNSFPLYLIRPGRLFAFLPVSYWQKPGPAELIISLRDVSGQEKEIKQSIAILDRSYPKEELTVSQELTNLRTEDKIKADSQKLARAKGESADHPLWQDRFLLPAPGEITTEYGLIRVINGQESERHSGLDIANKKGTPILATNSGRVTLADDLYVTGKTVVIDHGLNLYSSYSHLASLKVREGDLVQKGQVIGEMGSTGFSTGSHLHWVISVGRTPVDPKSFLDGTILPSVPGR